MKHILKICILLILPFASHMASADTFVPAPQWLLRFSANFNDSSGNGKIATSTLGATPALIAFDSERGQVFSKTSSSFVRVTHNLNGSYTKSAWVKRSVSNGEGYIIAASNSGEGDLFMVNSGTNGGVPSTLALKAGQSLPLLRYHVYNPVAFPGTAWVHTAVTYNSLNKEYRLYQDGQFIQASTTSQTADAFSTAQDIGAYRGAGTWHTKFDDAAVWDTVLSDAQILAVYQGNLGVTNEAPSAPLNLSGYAKNHAVDLTWSPSVSDGGNILTDYGVEYKISSDSTWQTFVDAVSTTTTATVTGLTNGQSYDFRVVAINAAGSSTPSTVVTSAPAAKTYMHILSGGQSLSLGVSGPITLTQPYNNVMLSSAPIGTSSPLIPLVEVADESPSSGMANSLTAYGSTNNPFVVGLHGKGGYEYGILKKGTEPYATGMLQASTTKFLVESQGDIYKPIAVTIVHGEKDWILGNFSQYEGFLKEWQSDYQTDINLLTGSNSVLPMFINQMNGKMTGEIGVAQLNAHKNNPGKIILAGPKYQYGYNSDGLHLTSTYSKHMGEMLAKVIDKVVFKGQTWNPLMPTSVVRDGRVITISYSIPVGQLEIDTSNVAARENYGFEFIQSGETASSTIESVELVNGATQVRITLSDVPNGVNQRVRYAWNCPAQESYGCASYNKANYVGGNIRDMDSSVSLAPGSTGLPLYNWSVTFDEAVTVPQPVSYGSGGGSYGSGGGGGSSGAPSTPTPTVDAPPLNSIPNLLPTIVSTPKSTYAFVRNLTLGAKGEDVRALQKYLNAKGFIVSTTGAGSPGKETNTFAAKTRAALARFQKANNIVPAVGYFGPVTRGFLGK